MWNFCLISLIFEELKSTHCSCFKSGKTNKYLKEIMLRKILLIQTVKARYWKVNIYKLLKINKKWFNLKFVNKAIGEFHGAGKFLFVRPITNRKVFNTRIKRENFISIYDHSEWKNIKFQLIYFPLKNSKSKTLLIFLDTPHFYLSQLY